MFVVPVEGSDGLVEDTHVAACVLVEDDGTCEVAVVDSFDADEDFICAKGSEFELVHIRLDDLKSFSDIHFPALIREDFHEA